MRLKSLCLLCAALLPAAALAGIDVGLKWGVVPPDTVCPDSSYDLSVYIKNYTGPAVSGISSVEMIRDSSCYYAETTLFSLLGGDSTEAGFGELWPERGFAARFSVHAEGDTYPANDTLWWRPHFLSGLAEEPQPQSVLSGLRALPTHFSGEVTVYCREPARLLIYSAAGNLVRTLSPASPAVWDGRGQLGRDLAPGIYLVVTPSPSSSPPEGERDRVRRDHASRVLKVILAR